MARGGIAISENFGDLLDPRFRKIYTTEYEENIKENMVPMLYGMETSNKESERVSGIGSMSDLTTFNGSIDYDVPSQLYDKVFAFPEKALGFKVERKLADDDLFGIMDRRPWQMAISVARTREKHGASIFNNAFTGTDGPDSLSLCNDSHPYSPDDATTQDNKGSSALTAVSIEATRRIGLTSIMSDRGEPLEINYDLILCAPAKEEKGWEVINSKGKVDTADNNRNFHFGRYKLAVWSKLSNTNNWFMIDSKLAKMFLLWWDRIKPEFEYDRDFDTKVAKWSIYCRYQAGWAAWQPIYGHSV